MGGGGLGQRGYTSEKLNLKPLDYLTRWCCGCGLGAGFTCAFGALQAGAGAGAGAEAGERGLPSGKKIHDHNDEECEDDLHYNVNGSTVIMLRGLRL